MYKPLLASEFLKIKRKWVWFLIALGPIGVIGLQALNFLLRYDYLTNLYKADLWGGLLLNIGSFVPPVIILGAAIITSIIANIEHQSTSWKHLLSLPIKKRQVFIAKFILSFSLLTLSCCLLMIGTIILGLCLRFGTSIPWFTLLKTSFSPYLAALPVLAGQLWIAITYRNQGVALTFGVLGAILAMYATGLPDWFIWKWPSLLNHWDNPMINVWLGIGIGIVIFFIETMDFVRRDVNH